MTIPAFQSLLENHREEVYRFLVALVGAQEADDCFQETFLAALRAYPRLTDSSNLRAWLFTIAGRKAVDSHRSRKRRPDPVAETPDAAVDLSIESVGNGAPVWEHVRGLPEKQRLAVVHRFVADLSYGEIAEAMGITDAAARQNVMEALRKLRKVQVR